MAVDWNAVSEAIRLGQTGRANEALRLLVSVESGCETDRDRAAVSLAQSMCFVHLGQIAKASALIAEAKQLAIKSRDLMLQVEITEANVCALSSEHQRACKLYERIAATYGDLLEADTESAQELNERYGYALVHVQRYGDAARILRRLLQSNVVEDEQRVRLYLGTALTELGHSSEARLEFELAAKGPNTTLSKDATERLSALTNSVQ